MLCKKSLHTNAHRRTAWPLELLLLCCTLLLYCTLSVGNKKDTEIAAVVNFTRQVCGLCLYACTQITGTQASRNSCDSLPWCSIPDAKQDPYHCPQWHAEPIPISFEKQLEIVYLFLDHRCSIGATWQGSQAWRRTHRSKETISQIDGSLDLVGAPSSTPGDENSDSTLSLSHMLFELQPRNFKRTTLRHTIHQHTLQGPHTCQRHSTTSI